MKRYKLIREYPGSPELGTVLRQWVKEDDKSNILYGSEYTLSPGLTPKIVENNPEFWEEIIEKDYEILSFKYGNGCPYYHTLRKNGFYVQSDQSIKSSSNYTLEEQVNDVKKARCIIYSVRRLSDGEIFTVGDKIEGYKNTGIKKITLDSNGLKIITDANGDGCVCNELGWLLKNCVKAKQPLFTTEDGVDIFEGDLVTPVNLDTLKIHTTLPINTGESLEYGNYKHFSTKEAAEEYVLMNKPCLSINDVENCLVGNLQNYFKKNLKDIVKSKL